MLQFRIAQGPDQDLTGVFDSPLEGVTDLPTTITADGTNVTIEIPVAAAVFEATVETDSLSRSSGLRSRSLPSRTNLLRCGSTTAPSRWAAPS